MSPSWRDRVVLAVYPERISWLRMDRGLSGHVKAHGTMSCTVEADSPWHGATTVLPEALRAANAANAQVKVLLSNRLVRYAITSNPDSARNREELDLLARHAFERIHGDAVLEWELRLSDAAPGKSALASAVDQALIAALREVVGAAGAQLVSLQPYLMATFNHFRRFLPRREGLFVLTEPQRVCQLAWKDGGWCAVQQMNAGHDWKASLFGTLDRLMITAGLQNMQALQLCAPELPDQTFAATPWQIQHLRQSWPKGLSPIQDRAYAGALLALS